MSRHFTLTKKRLTKVMEKVFEDESVSEKIIGVKSGLAEKAAVVLLDELWEAMEDHGKEKD